VTNEQMGKQKQAGERLELSPLATDHLALHLTFDKHPTLLVHSPRMRPYLYSALAGAGAASEAPL
jgi:hypothetical protein